jgi:hypothetical protein
VGFTWAAGGRYAVFGVALLVLVVVAARATALGGPGRVVTFAALRDTGAGLLVLAGTVMLVLWALTGRAARALDGAAFLLVGGGLLVLACPWGALLHHDSSAILISPACRLALGVPSLLLLIRSPGVLPVDSSVRPMGTLSVAAAWTLGLLGIEAIARLWGPIDSPAAWIVVMSVLALGWVVAGARRLTLREPTVATPGDRALGWSLIALGLGDILLAVTLKTDLRWAVVGAAVQLIGAAGAASIAVSWLLAVLSRDGSRKLRLAAELADVTNVLADEQSVRHHLLHDVRNVVTAIRAATITLERHGDRLDESVQDQLRLAVGAEFERLQLLLDQPREPVVLPPSAPAASTA